MAHVCKLLLHIALIVYTAAQEPSLVCNDHLWLLQTGIHLRSAIASQTPSRKNISANLGDARFKSAELNLKSADVSQSRSGNIASAALGDAKLKPASVAGVVPKGAKRSKESVVVATDPSRLQTSGAGVQAQMLQVQMLQLNQGPPAQKGNQSGQVLDHAADVLRERPEHASLAEHPSTPPPDGSKASAFEVLRKHIVHWMGKHVFVCIAIPLFLCFSWKVAVDL